MVSFHRIRHRLAGLLRLQRVLLGQLSKSGCSFSKHGMQIVVFSRIPADKVAAAPDPVLVASCSSACLSTMARRARSPSPFGAALKLPPRWLSRTTPCLGRCLFKGTPFSHQTLVCVSGWFVYLPDHMLVGCLGTAQVLCVHSLLEHTDVTIMYDNEALYDICRRHFGL